MAMLWAVKFHTLASLAPPKGERRGNFAFCFGDDRRTRMALAVDSSLCLLMHLLKATLLIAFLSVVCGITAATLHTSDLSAGVPSARPHHDRSVIQAHHAEDAASKRVIQQDHTALETKRSLSSDLTHYQASEGDLLGKERDNRFESRKSYAVPISVDYHEDILPMMSSNPNSLTFLSHSSEIEAQSDQVSGGSSSFSQSGHPILESAPSSATHLDSSTKRGDLAGTLTLTPDNTITNATFANLLCADLADYTGVIVTPSSSLYFLLPSCFIENATSLTSISLTRVVIVSESASTSPLAHFQASPSLASLSLSGCVFLNYDQSSYESLAGDWQELFSVTTSLASIQVRSCGLSGSLPATLPASTYSFDASYNKLTGSIPSTLFMDHNSTSTSLVLDLTQNQISGSIPSTLWSQSGSFDTINSVELSLGSNQLESSIPSTLLGLLSGASGASISLDLSKNELSGSIPSSLLTGITVSSLSFDVSANALNSAFPSSLLSSSTLSSMTALFFNASGCGLTGSLPTTLLSGWSTLNSLTFDVSRNQLGGSVPASLLASSASHAILSTKVDVSFNKISGSVPYAAFEALNLSGASSLTFLANDNAMTGSLPDALFSTYGMPTNTQIYLDVHNNLLSGSIPVSFFSSINPSSSSPASSPTPSTATSTYNLTVTLIASNTSLSGSLQIPDLSARSDVQALSLTVDVSTGAFTAVNIHENSYRFLVSLDIGNNSAMTGTLPTSLFFSNSTLQSLTGPYTGLNGVFPDLGALQPTQLRRLDLDSASGLDFCSQPRASWASTDLSCSLSNTNSYLCSGLYPSSCQMTTPPTLPVAGTAPSGEPASVEAPNPGPTALPQPSSTPTVPVSSPTASPSPVSDTIPQLDPSYCLPSTQPTPLFQCVGGIWTSNSDVTDHILTIPAGATETDIKANLSSYRIFINGLGSTVNVQDALDGLFHVKLFLTQADVDKMGDSHSQTVVTYAYNATDVSHIQITTLIDAGTSSNCKRVYTSTVLSDGTISAKFVIDNARCKVWWRGIITAFFGLLIIAGVIVGLMHQYAREQDTTSSETAT